MKKPTVMFDVDGTLIDFNGEPIAENVALYNWFASHGYSVGIWSAAGEYHAKEVGERLGLNPVVTMEKSENMGNKIYPDFAVDDLPLNIARNMIYVPNKGSVV